MGKTGKTKAGAPSAKSAKVRGITLAKGEKYIGSITGADGKGHHIVLLAGDESGNWQAMKEWAKKAGGDLPDRVEQALLFRDHRDEFKRDWYWSNTQRAGDAGCAWNQGFGYGAQGYSGVSSNGRARAVRRVVIQ